ncbi:MAG: thermonuclease family protein [Aeromicrobium sp.]
MTRTLRALFVIVVCVALGYALRSYLDAENEPAQPAPRAPNTALLHVTSLKDGDSWDASDGREYRLGLVNTPEPSEPCFREARQFTGRFLADGFRPNAYAIDVHGRHVAEVFDSVGRSLNVALAKSGLADGKYLNNFRHENPELAERVDEALASAAKPACRVR